MIYLPACEAFRDRRIRHERSCDPENVGEGVARGGALPVVCRETTSYLRSSPCTLATSDILNTSNEVRNVVSRSVVLSFRDFLPLHLPLRPSLLVENFGDRREIGSKGVRMFVCTMFDGVYTTG